MQDAKPEDVAEHTSHSWYKGAKPLNPSVGETDPEYTGYDPEQKYTWAKAPRLKNKPMEVGALARMLVAYASGQPTAKKLIDNTLSAIGYAGKPQVLLGVVGRIAARALECKMVADAMYQWGLDIVENIKKGKTEVYTPYEIPGQGKKVSDYGKLPEERSGIG